MRGHGKPHSSRYTRRIRLFLALNARFAQRRARTLLAVAGVALGVALGFGVHLVNRAAVDELAAGVRAMAGEADLEVLGGRGGFAEALYPKLARLPEVAALNPALELDAGLPGGGAIRVLGLDMLRAAQLQPALFAHQPQLRAQILKPDTVLLSQAAAERLRLGTGARLGIVVGLATVELEVIGTLPASSLHGVAALADIATVQWRLDRVGELNRIGLRLAPGADPEAMRARIAKLLPAGAHATRVETVEESGAALSRAYRVNLNVLALVALFTGGFLVFSAQALEVARRRGEHALLRVLGLTRGALARLVLLEASLVGAAGAALGLALGYGFAVAAVRASGGDFGAGMFRGLAPQIGFAPVAALGYFAAGVAVALVGAVLPAAEAARTPPAQALKAGDEQRMLSRAPSIRAALALLGAGVLLAFAPAVDGIPLAGYGAIGCLLVGGILLMPAFSQRLWRALPLARRPALALAGAQLRGAPGQAMVSLAAIVASFSLMVAMAIMVASFRSSVDRWLVALLPAELYLRTTQLGETAYVDPRFESRVRRLPQVARADFLRSARVTLDPAQPAISLLARDVPAGGLAASLPLTGARYERRADDPPPAWVSEAVAERYGALPGRRLALPLAGRQREFIVAGVWRDYARQHGAIVIERPTYKALTGDARANDAALWLAPKVRVEDAIGALRALPGGEQLDFGTPGEIRERSLAIFDRSFAVTYALEAVAVLVGLFGLSSSLGALVLARRREFGVLRHLGMTRREIGAMLATEGALLALAGAVAGLVLGAAISLVLVYVVNPQSFGWSMELQPPYGFLIVLTAVLLVLAMLTAWFSGREAMGMAPVRAVKDDW
ncbi:MAG: FtsX-like permease family protein [Betaproteobacteria bacterium]|nr:FtsX-like permease family protein [Betaproteobacteria bacterium]